MNVRNKFKIGNEYIKRDTWLNLPSIIAVLFVALTKGEDGLGFWPTLILGWLIYSFTWVGALELTIANKTTANKKQYYYLTFIFQFIFICLCLAYVLII